MLKFYAFYISTYTHVHEIKVAFITTYAYVKKDTLFDDKRIIIQNYGKEPETILKITDDYHYGRNKSYELSFSISERDTGFIIKPGEIVIKDLKNYWIIDKTIKNAASEMEVEQSFSFTMATSKGIIYPILEKATTFTLFKGNLSFYQQTPSNMELPIN